MNYHSDFDAAKIHQKEISPMYNLFFKTTHFVNIPIFLCENYMKSTEQARKYTYLLISSNIFTADSTLSISEILR